MFKQSYDNQVRFLTSDFDCCPKYSIYNESNLDNNKTVYVVEGIIDSMNIENAITICGVGISDDIINYLQKYKDLVWVVDNDEAGEELAERLMKLDQRCFVWPKKIKTKDINDICIQKNINYIPDKWLKKNSFRGIEGLFKLAKRNFK